GIHYQIRRSDSRRAFLFRSDAVSRLSADHERLANGAVLQQLQYSLPGIETVSSGARSPREAAWRGFGPERRTAVSVSPGEGEERGTCAADRRARSHRRRVGLCPLRSGALPHVFLPDREGQAVRGFRSPQMPVSLLLLHGPGLWFDPREVANL